MQSVFASDSAGIERNTENILVSHSLAWNIHGWRRMGKTFGYASRIIWVYGLQVDGIEVALLVRSHRSGEKS
jgi:hypothetical protein